MVIVLGLTWGFPQISTGQERDTSPLHYEINTTLQASLYGTTPFWHHANTYGLREPISQANSITDMRVLLPSRSWGPVGWSVGASLSTRLANTNNTAHFSELYGALWYRALRLRVGRFRHTIGGTDNPLSLGSMTISPNATPIPKIEFSTRGFVALPLSDGRLRMRAYWAEGQLGEARHVSQARLHQKSVHVRATGDRFRFTVGVIQNLQWGGKGRPDTWTQYRDILFNVRGGGGENTTAAYDLALSVDMDTWEVGAYRQFYLEDWIGLLFRSPWDGLWGVSVERDNRHWVSDVLYEFMNTIQQDALPGLPEGRAGYYTHHTYQSGWTHQGNVLGNPLIRNPQYRSSSYALDEQPSTMVIAHHLGLRGQPTARTEYEARFTYSRNYGICQDQIISGTCIVGSDSEVPNDLERIPRSELRQDQYATHLDVRYLLSETYGMHLRSSVAVDWGEFDGTQIGLMMGLQWDGTVSL